MKTILFDLDGVLFDIHSTLENCIKDVNPLFSMERVVTYDFNGSVSYDDLPDWIRITDAFPNEKQTYRGLNADYNTIYTWLKDVELFERSKYIDNAFLMLTYLTKYYKVVVHTLAYSYDIANFKSSTFFESLVDEKASGDISFICTVGDFKESLVYADYVVEDCIENCLEYKNIGVENFLLIDKPYNSSQFYEKSLAELPKLQRFSSTYKAFDYLVKMARTNDFI